MHYFSILPLALHSELKITEKEILYECMKKSSSNSILYHFIYLMKVAAGWSLWLLLMNICTRDYFRWWHFLKLFWNELLEGVLFLSYLNHEAKLIFEVLGTFLNFCEFLLFFFFAPFARIQLGHFTSKFLEIHSLSGVVVSILDQEEVRSTSMNDSHEPWIFPWRKWF